jgi:hypothetical protein
MSVETAQAGPSSSYPIQRPTTASNGGSSTPVTMTGGDAGSTSTYGGTFARSRGRPLTQAPVYNNEAEDSSEDVDPYPLAHTGSFPKPKRKKSRGASFSLPFHRRQRLSNGGLWKMVDRQTKKVTRMTTTSPRKFYSALFTIGLLVLFYNWWRLNYELQVELSVFSRRWIKSEVDNLQPLKGCFHPHHISQDYNMSKHLAPKYNDLSPGISMRRGMTCFDYSTTIRTDQPLSHLIYHTYWRSDLIPFGERQSATLIAFLATQPLSHSKLILWSNGADSLRENELVKEIMDKWSDYIEIKQADMGVLTKGTGLAGILSGGYGGGLYDQKGWVDGDAVRLLVLWHHGGVWMDMDEVLTKDIHPLTESEFVTQWDCYGESGFGLHLFSANVPDKEYFSLNGALMHFERHSPYLCEAFHIMASSPLPQPNTFSWGSFLYSKLHRRLLAAHIKPFAVLPWCFADPRNCRDDISFPDPFKPDPKYWEGRKWDGRGEVGKSGKELLDERIGQIWTIHLHNQWNKQFPKGGWMDQLFERYALRLDLISSGTDKAIRDVDARAEERGAVHAGENEVA